MRQRKLISEGLEQLDQVRKRVRDRRCRLARTVYALQHRRRTPDQILELLDRSARLLRRCQLHRQRAAAWRTIH